MNTYAISQQLLHPLKTKALIILTASYFYFLNSGTHCNSIWFCDSRRWEEKTAKQLFFMRYICKYIILTNRQTVYRQYLILASKNSNLCLLFISSASPIKASIPRNSSMKQIKCTVSALFWSVVKYIKAFYMAVDRKHAEVQGKTLPLKDCSNLLLCAQGSEKGKDESTLSAPFHTEKSMETSLRMTANPAQALEAPFCGWPMVFLLISFQHSAVSCKATCRIWLHSSGQFKEWKRFFWR